MNRYPLSWPPGWKRTPESVKVHGRFNTKTRQRSESGTWLRSHGVTISDGTIRVLHSLRMLGVIEGDAIISTNLRTKLNGLPYSGQPEPEDSGVAVYWRLQGAKIHRVMAVDLYVRVADNLAAVAATLEAMRAIERHGGAQILERAFTGFDALPPPRDWRKILNLNGNVSIEAIRESYRTLAKHRHPDHGGTIEAMVELNAALSEAEKELQFA